MGNSGDTAKGARVGVEIGLSVTTEESTIEDSVVTSVGSESVGGSDTFIMGALVGIGGLALIEGGGDIVIEATAKEATETEGVG